jgi:hypothetical protein
MDDLIDLHDNWLNSRGLGLGFRFGLGLEFGLLYVR